MPATSYERMTTLSITRPGGWRLRSGMLAFTLALFVPLAIPATASASGFPNFGPSNDPNIPVSNWIFGPQGQEFVNDVSASAPQQGNSVFNVKFQLGVGVTPSISAVQDVNAVADCNNCTAIAAGFQVVTTTLSYFTKIVSQNDDVANAGACTPTCTAIADGYQVVVATDTPQPLSFGRLLSRAELTQLNNVRTQFLDLPNSVGLNPQAIQNECVSLVNQVVSILESSSYATPYSPAIHGVGLAPWQTGSNNFIVKLYKSTQFFPASIG